MLATLSSDIRQYILITGNYWAFTLTDGALRMLIVLHFHQLGYSPLAIAFLFIFYETFGVITNLVGGWLGARLGLNKTMNFGLALQIVALGMLLVPTEWLTVVWVMAAQALSGIAKDLNKMSAKSSIKLLVPDDAQSQLYRWIALLTGSKNTLKGVGFFMGAVLLSTLGFSGTIASMLIGLTIIWILSLILLREDLGKTKYKPKFQQIFSKSPSINILSAARLFLFGARDVWFVVALPVYLHTQLHWDHWQVGSFIAAWIIAYGFVQGMSPYITHRRSEHISPKQSAVIWASILMLIPALISLGLIAKLPPETVLIIGLLIFGAVFAINSSLHSYLIVGLSNKEGISMDVGFYYMANAMGRLVGTLLSGWVFQVYGLEVCLIVSSVFVLLAALLSLGLPTQTASQ